MANTLFLQLEGALQSWGERAHWSVRDTAPEPTKSGIVGLLGCALGLKADEDLRQLSRSLRLGVRCDRPGLLLIDYHTVSGGVLSAQGKIKKTAGTGKAETVLSWRHYLCDASFLVALQSNDPELIDRLAEAVQDPHWPIYLGRKSCPPSRPPFVKVGDYPDLKSALESVEIYSNRAEQTIQAPAVLECAPEKGTRRRDEISSNSRRTFLPRYTCTLPVTVQVQKEEE